MFASLFRSFKLHGTAHARLDRHLLRWANFVVLAGVGLVAVTPGARAQSGDPLPSWNASKARQEIVAFVDAVTKAGSPDFVPVPERIATFDNDGTLWVEQPAYAQAFFAVDRLKAMAPLNPGWTKQEPYKSILAKGLGGLGGLGETGLANLIGATHSGTTPSAFRGIVAGWLAQARHPRFERPFTELTYQPMLEVLMFLRANGFKTFIVTGGGVEFVRAFAEERYGIPPEQVIGSRIETKFQMRDGQPELFRKPTIDFVNDGPGKPVGIEQQIGRRPIAAFGNSDGDLQMLQWATEAGKRRLGVIVHHTDAQREYAYDTKSSVGRLDKALEAAAINRWTVIDMKTDWKVIFPFQKQ